MRDSKAYWEDGRQFSGEVQSLYYVFRSLVPSVDLGLELPLRYI